MNREIKFRALDKSINKILHVVGITWKDGKVRAVEVEGGTTLYSPSFVLMQNTGLKDKNGKEIYEGDILFYWDLGPRGTARRKEKPVLVEWRDWRWSIKNGKTYEVIGNIYEDNHLLEDRSGV